MTTTSSSSPSFWMSAIRVLPPSRRLLRCHRLATPTRANRCILTIGSGRDDEDRGPAGHTTMSSPLARSLSSFQRGARKTGVAALSSSPWSRVCYYHSPIPSSSPPPTEKSSNNSNSHSSNSISNNNNRDDPNPLDANASLLARYEAHVRSGEITRDPHQIRVLHELERLRLECLAYLKRIDASSASSSSAAVNAAPSTNDDEAWSFGRLFSLTPSWAHPVVTAVDNLSNPQLAPPPKGIYLHGGPGCGKTHLMNVFYESLPSSSSSSSSSSSHKQKVHFHKFMLDVHRQMHLAQTVHGIRGSDAVLHHVLTHILQKGRILCFDEFQVTDVADALLLRRLFTGLVERGAVVVATSNRSPRELYKGGLQRELFLPFVDWLEETLVVVGMWDSEVDYRLVMSSVGSVNDDDDYDDIDDDDDDDIDDDVDSHDDDNDNSHDDNVDEKHKNPHGRVHETYFIQHKRNNHQKKHHKHDRARRKFDSLFRKLTKDSPIESTVIDVQNRQLFVPHASLECDVAKFSFYDLCGRAKGAADYLAIGERFHTVFVEDVPALTFHEINLARRWITFVDAMYECRVKLVVCAETAPEEMFRVEGEGGWEHTDEVFAFERTRSRMEEMRSERYLRKTWVGSMSESHR